MRHGITRLVVFLFTALVSRVGAATFYVAPWGDNGNPGTFELPWRTVGKAAATMVAGDSVLIRGGTYNEGVNPSRSGTPGLPIAYARYQDEPVVIEGGDTVRGWVQDSGYRYRASVSFTCDPRFTSVRDPNGNHGGLVVQDGAKMRYAMSPSPAAVDSPGEYYMNDSAGMGPPYTLYVQVRDLGRGVDPGNYTMLLGRYRKGFDLDGGEDYQVADGLAFRYYNDNAIHSIGSTDCEFRNLTLYTNFITGIYLTAGSRQCLIERCSFWDNGHAGVELAGSRRVTVRKNRFTRRDLGDGRGGNGAHMWLGPVSQFADSNLVENNIAFVTGRQGYAGPFAAVAGSYNVIRHNSMVNGAGGAIALLDGGHNTVVNNACDMSAATAHGIAVFPNAVQDSFHYITGNCFYALDPTGKYWWNNVVYNRLAEWEAASGQAGNIDSLPGFLQPDSEDLHLVAGSACIDRGTSDSAATEDYDENPRPLGQGYDIGAYEYVPVSTPGRTNTDGHGWRWSAMTTIGRVGTGVTLTGSEPGGQGPGGMCILDMGGRLVRSLASSCRGAQTQWDCRDSRGAAVGPGVYFVQGRVSGDGSQGPARKVVLLQ